MNRSYLSEFINIILLGLVLFLWFTRGCGDGKNSVVLSDTVTTVSYIHDTVWHAPVVKTVHTPAEIVYRDIDKKLDTVFIIRKFAASYFYDEMISDSNIDIHVLDTISMNEIVWRDVQYSWKQPVRIIKNVITPPAEQQTKLFIGAMLGGNKEGWTSISPQLELVTKQDHAFMVGYNLMSHSVEMGYKRKISLRK